MIYLNVNDKDYEIDVPYDMPLLWAIRDHYPHKTRRTH